MEMPPSTCTFTVDPGATRCRQKRPSSSSLHPTTSWSTSHTLKPLPCWGLVHSAGELLQTPERNSTSMTNNLRLKTNGHLLGYWVSEHLSTVTPCPMHPSSPVLCPPQLKSNWSVQPAQLKSSAGGPRTTQKQKTHDARRTLVGVQHNLMS